MIIQTDRRFEIHQKIDSEWWIACSQLDPPTPEEARRVAMLFKAIMPKGRFMIVRRTETVDVIEEI